MATDSWLVPNYRHSSVDLGAPLLLTGSYSTTVVYVLQCSTVPFGISINICKVRVCVHLRAYNLLFTPSPCFPAVHRDYWYDSYKCRNEQQSNRPGGPGQIRDSIYYLLASVAVMMLIIF